MLLSCSMKQALKEMQDESFFKHRTAASQFQVSYTKHLQSCSMKNLPAPTLYVTANCRNQNIRS